MKFLGDSTIHGSHYDFTYEKALSATNAISAQYLLNNDESTYHFSTENGTLPLYNTDNTIVYNTYGHTTIPKFDSDESSIRMIEFDNRKNNMLYSYNVNNEQPNYDVYLSNNPVYGACTEYAHAVNGSTETANVFARIPFRFTAVVRRKSDSNLTPDFDYTKPLGTINSIYSIAYENWLVNGPTYVLGSCIARPDGLRPGSDMSFPNFSYRSLSREMFFFVNTLTGEITLQPSNCIFGNKKYSIYHCSYTNDILRKYPVIELTFNTTLYVQSKQ